MSVDLFYQLVSIRAVNGTSILDGLTASGGATEAVHTDLQKEDGGIGSGVKHVANDGFFCYLHFILLSQDQSLEILHLYYITKTPPCQAKSPNFLVFSNKKTSV